MTLRSIDEGSTASRWLTVSCSRDVQQGVSTGSRTPAGDRAHGFAQNPHKTQSRVERFLQLEPDNDKGVKKLEAGWVLGTEFATT
jgi:hypothetical protein